MVMKKTINVDLETWRELMRIKIDTNASSVDEVLRDMIKLWKKIKGGSVTQ